MEMFIMYTRLVILVKILFIILAVYLQFIKYKNPNDKKSIEKFQNYKDHMEFIFKALMSAMLIYVFNPRFNNLYLLNNYETRLLFYLFGFILLITAEWKIFFQTSEVFKELQKSLS